MNYSKEEKIREKMRSLILDSISEYLDNCDVDDYIDRECIDMVVEERIGNYISNMMAAMLEEVADEVFETL